MLYLSLIQFGLSTPDLGSETLWHSKASPSEITVRVHSFGDRCCQIMFLCQLCLVIHCIHPDKLEIRKTAVVGITSHNLLV